MDINKAPDVISDLKPYSANPGSHHVLKDIYSFFGNNVTNSVAVYIGVTDWKQDLQLLETYAVPTIICDPFDTQSEWRTAVTEKRAKLMDWMKYLKESDCGNHFVNPKWIEPVVEYPGIYDGILGAEPNTTKLSSWETLLTRAKSLRNNASTTEPHFAVCKIELFGEEVPVLSSLLATKYRPSILYLRWSESQDLSQTHCEAAGHLQGCGYRLISINENGFFLYQYSGQDIYSCCSWTNVSLAHPFITLMKDQVSETIKSIVKPAVKASPEVEGGNEPSS